MSESSRSKNIIELRPKLPADLISLNISENEQFQNSTLRPILKFQHEVFMEITKNYISSTKPKFYEETAEKRETFIRASLTKNTTLKQRLVGIVIGHMSLSELKYFLINQSEFTKRITQMITNRIVDSLHEFE